MRDCRAAENVRLRRLDGEIADEKSAIRLHRRRLHDVAAARRQLIEKMKTKFGIEVVLVGAADAGQGVEGTTHGRQDEGEA